jgi:hypothetical protein
VPPARGDIGQNLYARAVRPDHHELPDTEDDAWWYKSCRHQGVADLQGLVDAGCGDVSLVRELRSRLTNFVCTDDPSG